MSEYIYVTGEFIRKAKELWKLDQLVQVKDEGLKCVVRYGVYMKFGKKPDCDPRGYFTNETHYLILANNINWDGLLAVLLAEPYAVFMGKINPKDRRSYTWYYVVGRQVGGGLFLHEVELRARPLIDLDRKAVFIGRVDTSVVYAALGYGYDMELNPVDLNEVGYGFVRVQGDVAMRIARVLDFREEVGNVIAQQLFDILTSHYIRKIADELMNNGVNVDITASNTLFVPFPNTYNLGEVEGALHEYVSKIVSDPAVRIYVRWSLNPLGFRVELRVNRDVVMRGDANSYMASIYHSVVDAVAREYVKYEGEYQLSFGRHVIRYVGWPQSASMFVDTPIGKLLINVAFPATQFIAREVMITHPEHKPFYYRFNEPMRIEVYSINNRAVDLENYYALTKLLNIKRSKIAYR
ncbi:hypothetical protein [Vulcanisaeta sp. JCM 14467]|uniref:hypothetical protein n=1 Tax=Vulcanisaeta sp. JCM 14467 TaxID=1295370 RepID=UPI0006D1C987|nr:hypothetical protein [Vulcanisaeta sp. JCM 14467]